MPHRYIIMQPQGFNHRNEVVIVPFHSDLISIADMPSLLQCRCDCIMFVFQAGSLKHFFLEDWQYVNEYRHVIGETIIMRHTHTHTLNL